MTTWTHVGNVGKFVLTPGPVPKEHYTSMAGSKSIDMMAITEKRAKFEMDVDEIVQDNAVMALMGIAATDTTGDYINIMGAASVIRQIKFDGSNDFGAQVEVILPRVFMYCTNAIDLIGDDWAKLNITGEVLRDSITTGSFGTWRFLDATNTTGAPLATPNVLNYMIGKGNIYTAPLA